jgi:hypothetical protein
MSNCELCGESMPAGEEMFKFHGYSCECPKPRLKPVKFRKRPVVIEARQVTEAERDKVCVWAIDGGATAYVPFSNDGIVIKTLEGDMKADIGDWIIRGVKGEHYPCKPDIFEATYEPAP